jgi:hypothetical protein
MNDQANTQFAATPQHYMDRRAIPPRAEAADGTFVDISGDERLPGLWREFLDDACEHPGTVIVRRINAAGAPFFSRYCPHCGVKWSAMIARAAAEREGIAPDLTEQEMEQRADAYLAQREEHFSRIIGGAAERALEKRLQSAVEYSERYQDYLRSPQWKRKTAAIMERAGGKCEGCLSCDAEEVHHTTYEHVFNEFAFELLALCSPCHRRFHGKDA